MSNRVIPMEMSNAQGNLGNNLNIKEAETKTTATYSTSFNVTLLIGISIAFIAGIGLIIAFIVLTIQNGYNTSSMLCFGLLGLFFIIIGFIVGSCSSLYTSITVDYKLGAIFIKTIKICCCLSKSFDIQINQIKKVIIRNDFNTTFKLKKHGGVYYAFEIFFTLVDGSTVEGCSGLIDKNHEGKKVFLFLRSSLPKKIKFSGNLVSRKRRR